MGMLHETFATNARGSHANVLRIAVCTLITHHDATANGVSDLNSGDGMYFQIPVALDTNVQKRQENVHRQPGLVSLEANLW